MTHITQPTKRSCVPTCLAMLSGAPVDQILQTRKTLTTRRGEGTTLPELLKLAAIYGLSVGTETKQRPLRGFIKWHHRTPAGQFRFGWHCLVIDGDRIHDPGQPTPYDATWWLDVHKRDKVLFYPVAV